jgi:rod shape-determining protein MreB
MAAAIGADLPIHEPKGNMVLDIGGGTSEVAVITMSSIAYAESVRVAGDEMNEAVQRFFQDEFKLLIGENTAERVKMRIGTAYPPAQPMTMEVSGRDIVSGTPKSIEVGDAQVRAALNDPVQAIVLAVKKALERTPPELAADIGETGLLLAGGGSLLKGLDRLIAEATNLKVRIDEDPLTTVVRGTGRTLSDRAFFERVYIN